MKRPRPTSLSGLFFYWCFLKAPWLLFAISAGAVLVLCTPRPTSLRFGTFNIERFPNSEAQVQGAFDTLQALHIDALAVQEILDPARFAAEARARLGERFVFVHSQEGSRFRLGVLLNQERFTLLSQKTYLQMQVEEKTKPAFEVRAKSNDGVVWRILVVHLASTNERRTTREKQHQVLRTLIASFPANERLVVLGDFNATKRADREDLALTARSFSLTWATEPLPCTSYWQRKDGCYPSALDHVLSFAPPHFIEACGPCKEQACQQSTTCPDFVSNVSDHCPVIFDFDAF